MENQEEGGELSHPDRAAEWRTASWTEGFVVGQELKVGAASSAANRMDKITNLLQAKKFLSKNNNKKTTCKNIDTYTYICIYI